MRGGSGAGIRTPIRGSKILCPAIRRRRRDRAQPTARAREREAALGANGTNGCPSYESISGWRGAPLFVRPRQRRGVRGVARSHSTTRAACSAAQGVAPQAQTTALVVDTASAIASRFFRSSTARRRSNRCLFNSRGSVARHAKRFTTTAEPYPARLVKPTTLRIVGSSFCASAVLGFSISQHRLGPTTPGITRSST